MTAATPLVRIEELSHSFGRLRVLSKLSLQIDEGELVGVIGPNGAGKSTLLSLISGSLVPTIGSVSLAGEDITRRPAHWRARHGVALSHQVPRPFGGMSVLENVLVSASLAGGRRGRAAADAAMTALERTHLAGRANESAGALRLLDLKRLEVARALAADPRLLLLDEIAGGLTEAELPEIIDLVREVHAAGTTIVWIEHVVHALTAVATRLVCLTYGELIADGTPDEVLANPAVRSVYLGLDPEVETPPDDDAREGLHA
ncbi:Branched-chain amino acid transport ATP-binding protein LivG (TC 3.A.1.4.1) [Actinomycetales bacterium JB111]|nr:Branched-chain amino acid transport ATP-binding protein LivG (TC 3.A.1.4.1) [Actinomycetales bacterium JB111]